MDNKNDLILQLAKMLQTKGSKPSIGKMPDKNYVRKAKNKNANTFFQVDELKDCLNSRLLLSGVDATNAKLFLLMPYSKNQWKVFVVDGNDEVCAQLDDYCDTILESKTKEVSEYCKSPFVVSI